MKKQRQLGLSLAILTMIPACTSISNTINPAIKTEHRVTEQDLQARLNPDYERPKLIRPEDQKVDPRVYPYTQQYVIDSMSNHTPREPHLLEAIYYGGKMILEGSKDERIQSILKTADQIEEEVEKYTTLHINGWEVKFRGNGFHATKE